MTALRSMIHMQADAIERLAAADLTAPADRLRGAKQIFLVGTGTSQHAAELGALMFVQAGLDARWCTSAWFARSEAPLRPGDAVIVITHTAETAYARRSRGRALDAGVPVVSVTGIGSGWPEAVETVERERSETYTVSYTAALTILAGLAGRLGAPDLTVQALRRTAEATRRVCAQPDVNAIALPDRALALIGSGPWGVTAREGALKIREAARMLSEGFEAENFLHGNAVPFGAADGLILIEPDADRDGLVAALGEAARIEGITVSTVAGPDADLPPLLAQIPLTVRLQLLSARFAELRGQDPDIAIVGAWARPALWAHGG